MAKRKTRFDKIYVLDTNIILNDVENIFTLSENGKNLIILPETVLDEIDSKKTGLSEVAYQAREFGRTFNEAEILQVDRAGNKKLVTIHAKAIKDARIAYIDVISKRKYDSDNDNSIDPKIKNDRKIIEIARDIQTENSNVFFISLDIMAKNRALSIGVDVQTMSNKSHKKIVLSAKLQIEAPKPTYSVFDIYSMDVPETVQHLEIIDKNSKPFYYYKTGNSFVLIDEDKLKKQEVPPVNMGQKVLMSQMLDEYYNVVVSDSPAGCVLPGTNIKIKYKEKEIHSSEIFDKFGITFQQMGDLRKFNFIRYKKISSKTFIYYISDFTKDIILFTKLRGTEKLIFHNDKKFSSKYLQLRYWLYKFNIPKAIEMTKYCRKYEDYFERNYNNLITNSFNPVNIENTITKCQQILLTSKPKLSASFLERDFWRWRGYSEEWIDNKISKLQSYNGKKNILKYSKQELKERSKRCLEYWVKNGFTKEEAKKKVKEVQTTFSLNICIDKYGIVEGTKIFQDRQDRWQNTIQSKPKEELDKINKSKGTRAGTDIPNYGYYNFELFKKNRDIAETPGFLYYISFIYNDKTVYKVGITKNLEQRLSSFNNLDILYIYEGTLEDCFIREQFLLSKYHRYRISIDRLSTELFSNNILGLEND